MRCTSEGLENIAHLQCIRYYYRRSDRLEDFTGVYSANTRYDYAWRPLKMKYVTQVMIAW
ncbi:hypothetical protein DH86_00000666 [Scytalidium sp. 3C]|nr:hypothetical protein DH86_00000666 [Scytalidium sp. 3C]